MFINNSFFTFVRNNCVTDEDFIRTMIAFKLKFPCEVCYEEMSIMKKLEKKMKFLSKVSRIARINEMSRRILRHMERLTQRNYKHTFRE